ncbi:cardiolipin synthase [Bacillus mangrovi]|uniref:Cardiolipin synthase n=1 Tax=Metabacillus mangrovi TaxID=1491830 RepID=A0A7X2S353_9BACI|nr:phospholipase D-like domain-containing protein [Metabacillus mangrovi]MTH51951.1 cardiolipin synthase [Metabacillus mangrovi]
MLKKAGLIFLLFMTVLSGTGYRAIRNIQAGAEEYNHSHPLIESPVFQGDAVLLNDGAELYKRLFYDIDHASSSIYIHFFIIRDDKISREFIEKLSRKAKQGVDVKLSADAVGSTMDNQMMEKLKENGGKFTASRSPGIRNFFYELNHRNHRKLAVIDGRISYLGGFNMGEEYLGNDPKFGYWRDYHIRLTGGGARSVSEQFKRDWEEDNGKRDPSFRKEGFLQRGPVSYQFLFSTGGDLENRMIGLIHQAKEEIFIATPYFLPTDALMEALQLALHRKVSVHLLLPDHPDYWYTKPPSYPKTRMLLKNGAVVHLYRNGFFHGKVMVIDEKIADIGTANWDPRSLYLNDEANCLIYSPEFIREIKKELQEDFGRSRILTEEMYDSIPWWESMLERPPLWLYRLL